MVSMKGAALYAALLLVTTHTVASVGDDYDSEDYNDGSCSYRAVNCAPGALCSQNLEHTRFKCYCPEGFSGDGYSEEFRAGATGCSMIGGPILCASSNECHEFATCQPYEGFQMQCKCNEGFTGNGAFEEGGCTDIEECLGNPCALHANCSEIPGSYVCECDGMNNYEGDGNVECIWVCYGPADCDINAKCLDNGTCECDSGFEGDGRSCTDIDECTNGGATCPAKSTCNNIPGSFECVCQNGFELKDAKCEPYPKSCEEIFQAVGKSMPSGRYTVDLDGEGDLPAIEVDCVVTKTFAITEIAPTESFPQPVPKNGGEKLVEYPVDPQPLIDASDFCYQEVWLQCTKKMLGGMIQWEDASGVKHAGWGGKSDGKCACGEFDKCVSGKACNCGFGSEGVDDGYIFSKEQLPLTKVIFPNVAANTGNYKVGRLRCAPRSFDLPKNCQEAKFGKQRQRENKVLYIDIDGEGSYPPFLVYCNMEAFGHVGIIEIPTDKVVVGTTTTVGEPLNYLLDGPDVEEVIKGSVFCSQSIEYTCGSKTIDQSGVQVTTRTRTISYIPGSGADEPGSCGCGLTNSCEDPTVKCNCNVDGDNNMNIDMGLLIDKSDLPLMKLSTTSSDNFFKVGPLQCSQNQFGIEPNCEKYRQAGITKSYTYVIDPDGPGNLDPFPVKCEMDPNQGVTVINNEDGGGLDLSSGKSFTINYLKTTPAQVNKLKGRSTSCVQDVTFSKCVGTTVSIDNISYNNGKSLSDILTKACSGTDCTCGTPLTILEKDKLPIVEIQGGDVTVTIGPLRCTEIFPDCNSYQVFLKTEGVLGERKIAKDVMTIDPDGAGGGDPFVVNCQFKDTIIDSPEPDTKPYIKHRAGKNNPGKKCWTMNYSDQTGAGIGAPQMAALMKTAKYCTQMLRLTCENALATGMVSYRTCGGREYHTFVDAEVESTCTCGAAGTCDGGVNEQCNCDTSGSVKTVDENLIISNKRLPICEVCMELEDIEAGGAGAPNRRSIRFDVSQLKCGKKQGRRPHCQMYRQEDEFDFLTDEMFKNMWFEATGKPVVVGCRFTPDPPMGEMVIRPNKPLFEPGEDYNNGNVTVIYKGFQIVAIREAIDEANYCTQDILFFCADAVPDLTGSYGLFSDGTRLQASDYEMRDMSSDEVTALCDDTRFSQKCQECPNPKRLVITNKDRIPLTNVFLPPQSSVTVGFNDANCAYIEKDCDAIYQKDKTESNLLFDGYYLVDPDQAGPLRPFKVLCDFTENVGITKVPANPTWVEGGVGGSGDDDGEEFSFKHKYPTATPEQINSLVQNSEFCWQGVKYECTGTPLSNGGTTPNSVLLGYQEHVLNGFGTADDSSYNGCACGVLGTCKVKGLTCNCDSRGSMVDQGFVTDKDVLPITGFNANYDSPSSEGKLTVTDVRCGPSPVDIPRDCAEAASWGVRNGIDYSKKGEILIAPGDVTPFLAYCDYSLDPNNPVTRVKPRPPVEDPTSGDSPEQPKELPTDDQMRALMEVSTYCYQPVKVSCYGTAFMQGGAKFSGLDGRPSSFWSSGVGNSATCTCGTEEKCGGAESRQKQKQTKCNCDVGDDVIRHDAAILQIKTSGPLTTLDALGYATSGQLNLTVGDVFCAKNPIEFDECTTGFNDCAPEARCVDEPQGYRCECPVGWQGKISRSSANPDPPRANGRQCIDDDECSRPNLCRYNSVCVNTPGSYRCDCKEGYRNVDDYTCENINECKEGLDDCDVNARCKDTDGSYRCRCKKGYRGNGREGNCFPIGQCTCFGDPHCISFDGKWNHYQGLCSYVMVQSGCGNANSELPEFKVTTHNWDHGYVGHGKYAWIKEVTIEVYNQTIVIGQERTITVNGQSQKFFKLLDDNGDVMVRVGVVGFKVLLSTNFGLDVMADGVDQVTVEASANLRGSVCGLCGPYNDNRVDDWTVGPKCPAKEGEITDRETLFGNSWSVDPDDSCDVDCDPVEPAATCDVDMAQAEQVCNRLFNDDSPFVTGGCLALMPREDLDGFRFSCKYDLCHTNPANLGAAMCRVAEALARYCSDLMADGFEWRSEDMCGVVTCGDNEEYLVCGPEEEPTCLNQNPPIDQCMESCYCQKGYMREASGGCVRAEDCGCLYGDMFMSIRERRLVEDCTKSVMCVDHNDTRVMDNTCAENEECSVDDLGVMSCIPVTTTPVPTTTTPVPTTTTPVPTTTTPVPPTTTPVPPTTTTPVPPTTTPVPPTTTPVPPTTTTPVPPTTTTPVPPTTTPVPPTTTPVPPTTTPVPPTTTPVPPTTTPVPPTTTPVPPTTTPVPPTTTTVPPTTTPVPPTTTPVPPTTTPVPPTTTPVPPTTTTVPPTTTPVPPTTTPVPPTTTPVPPTTTPVPPTTTPVPPTTTPVPPTTTTPVPPTTTPVPPTTTPVPPTTTPVPPTTTPVPPTTTPVPPTTTPVPPTTTPVPPTTTIPVPPTTTPVPPTTTPVPPTTTPVPPTTTPVPPTTTPVPPTTTPVPPTTTPVPPTTTPVPPTTTPVPPTTTPVPPTTTPVPPTTTPVPPTTTPVPPTTTPVPPTTTPVPPTTQPNLPTTPPTSTTVAPPPTAAPTSSSSTAGPPVEPTTASTDLCSGVDCSGQLNTECVDGQCVCKMGFSADCEHCKDIDECEIGENECVHIGQHCVNTEGSYYCTCVEGFEEKDGYCHDINECEDPATNCGPHAECRNRLGTYECVCCMGYSKNGELCQRDTRLDAVYGAPGEECCACSGEPCNNPDPVCGTDGQDYNNYAAMVVAGCRANKTIEVNYRGKCEDACEMVTCDKPYQTCTQNGPGGAAMCICPSCGGGDSEEESEPVCGSNRIMFPSECVFRMFVCATGRTDITILDSLEPCGGQGGDEPVGPWSTWSDCDNDCGLGKTTRTRRNLGNANTDIYPLEQESACYTTCVDGPCRADTCSNPGQVCQADSEGHAECVCPNCQGRPDEPVCALVGNVVRTYDNECLARRAACELTKQVIILESRACEDTPRDCSVVRNFAKLKDDDNCTTVGDVNIGFCYGGCGDSPGECCRPDRSYTVHAKEVALLNYYCPDGSSKTRMVEVIKGCKCVVEPQHAPLSVTSN